MTEDNSILRFEQAKSRVAESIASAWRHYDDQGEHLPVDCLRENFSDATSTLDSLSALWAFIDDPLKQVVRDKVQNPAVGVINSDGTSWQSYEEMVLGYLDRGEHLSLGAK